MNFASVWFNCHCACAESAEPRPRFIAHRISYHVRVHVAQVSGELSEQFDRSV